MKYSWCAKKPSENHGVTCPQEVNDCKICSGILWGRDRWYQRKFDSSPLLQVRTIVGKRVHLFGEAVWVQAW
jgi:hypothetical protein